MSSTNGRILGFLITIGVAITLFLVITPAAFADTGDNDGVVEVATEEVAEAGSTCVNLSKAPRFYIEPTRSTISEDDGAVSVVLFGVLSRFAKESIEGEVFLEVPSDFDIKSTWANDSGANVVVGQFTLEPGRAFRVPIKIWGPAPGSFLLRADGEYRPIGDECQPRQIDVSTPFTITKVTPEEMHLPPVPLQEGYGEAMAPAPPNPGHQDPAIGSLDPAQTASLPEIPSPSRTNLEEDSSSPAPMTEQPSAGNHGLSLLGEPFTYIGLTFGGVILVMLALAWFTKAVRQKRVQTEY